MDINLLKPTQDFTQPQPEHKEYVERAKELKAIINIKKEENYDKANKARKEKC
jgi:hypothetical protein